MGTRKMKNQYFKELSTLGFTVIRSAIPEKSLKKIEFSLKEARAFLERNHKTDLYRISSFLNSPSHIGFLCPLIDSFCEKEIISSDFYLLEYNQ